MTFNKNYLGHLFNITTDIIAYNYYKCSKCSIILFNGTCMKYKFCDEDLSLVSPDTQNELENLTCNEMIIKNLLE